MKKKLLKLTETQAKLLEILLTIFGIILIIIFGISLGLNFPLNQERIGNFVRVLIFLLTIGWFILVINFGDIIKIEKRNIKSKKFDVKCSSFYSLKNSLSKFLSKKEYKDIFMIENSLNCNIYCFLKERSLSSRAYILIDLSGKEITEEFRKAYFDVCLEYLAKKYPELTGSDIYVTHILCVDKTNDITKKITERVAIQDRPVYQLPIVISLSNQKMYVASSDYVGIKQYDKMLRIMKDYIKKQDLYL